MENKLTFFTSPDFKNNIKKLLADYDQVFICSSDNETNVALMALSSLNPTIILLTSLRRTKKLDIKKLKANHYIDVMFYE